MNPALWNYPGMLMTFCELIIGIPRQMSGQGTQHDVETLGGQQLQLDRAATTLKPYWENVKDEHAWASQNAIECLQALMRTGAVTKIWDVVESRGGGFENNEVDWTSMQGQVEFSMDEDQDLPVDPAELRAAIEAMFEALKENNPAAAEWFSVPANQDLALSTMLPGTVNPKEAQTLKTEYDIQTIVNQGAQVKMNPDGTVGSELPVHPDKMENFGDAKMIVSQYMLKNFELRAENPMAWAALLQYWDELDNMDMQVAANTAQRQLKVHQAGSPPPDKPDPGTMQTVAELHKLATQMADRLGQLAMLDPMATKGTASAQVSAANDVVGAAIKATTAMSK